MYFIRKIEIMIIPKIWLLDFQDYPKIKTENLNITQFIPNARC